MSKSMSVKQAASNLYQRLLARFPQNFHFSFAYGSGVKTQIGYENTRLEENVIDLMICVDDNNIKSWHKENLKKNPNDYSAMKYLGSSIVSKYQKLVPAHIYCNTLIPIPEENVTIKYGVITQYDLITDCVDWRDIYVAGRLQKPVNILKEPEKNISLAMRSNLRTALLVALLLLPEKFTEYELYYTIAQLSYSGDFRMIFGENPNKVKNIVEPQMASFRELYSRVFHYYNHCLQVPSDSSQYFHQDKSNKEVHCNINRLPDRYFHDYYRIAKPELEVDPRYQKILRKLIARQVFKSSTYQSLKNIPTAGIEKSLRYSYKKALKTFT